MSTTEITKIDNDPRIVKGGMSREQVELLKQSICKGASDDELRLFAYQCSEVG